MTHNTFTTILISPSCFIHVSTQKGTSICFIIGVRKTSRANSMHFPSAAVGWCSKVTSGSDNIPAFVIYIHFDHKLKVVWTVTTSMETIWSSERRHSGCCSVKHFHTENIRMKTVYLSYAGPCSRSNSGVIHKYGPVDGMRNDTWNISIRRKHVSLPFCSPEILHGLACDRTRVAAVGSRRVAT